MTGGMRAAQGPRVRPGPFTDRGDQREAGSASVLIAAAMGVVVLLGSAALIVTGYSVAFQRARASADLVALSAATTRGSGGDACSSAARIARQNFTRLISCTQVGDADDYVVSVEVEVALLARVPGLPTAVTARAHAGALPLGETSVPEPHR